MRTKQGESKPKLQRTSLVMEFYERYSAKSETFTCEQHIENFSIRLCNGSSVTCRREHAGCEWIFTLNVREDAMDAMFSREYGRSSSPFVKTKVFIVDCFGRSSLHAEKNVRFECAPYTENVLHLTKDYLLNGRCGLNQLLYVPGDTLTLKWEVTTYECSEITYDNRKEEFENSSRIPGGVFSWQVAKFLLKFLLKFPLKFLLKFLALCCLFISIFAVIVMFVISVYTFFQTVVIPFLAAVAIAVVHLLLCFSGLVFLLWFNGFMDNNGEDDTGRTKANRPVF